MRIIIIKMNILNIFSQERCGSLGQLEKVVVVSNRIRFLCQHNVCIPICGKQKVKYGNMNKIQLRAYFEDLRLTPIPSERR